MFSLHSTVVQAALGGRCFGSHVGQCPNAAAQAIEIKPARQSAMTRALTADGPHRNSRPDRTSQSSRPAISVRDHR